MGRALHIFISKKSDPGLRLRPLNLVPFGKGWDKTSNGKRAPLALQYHVLTPM
jgi:hypothetical protein